MQGLHGNGLRWFALALGVALVLGAAPPQEGATRVGVLDMKIIFDDYRKSIEYDKDLKALRGQVEEDQKRREQELEQIAQDLQELAEGHPSHTDTLIDLRSKKVDLDYWMKKQMQMLRAKLLEYTDEIEGDIRRAAREVAEVQGLDLIINYASDATERETPAAEKRIPIVIFARKELDVTQAVLENLNQAVRKRKAGAEAAGDGSPPPPEKE